MLALFLIVLLQTADQPKRPLEAVALVNQARDLPPEFSADSLLRLADSSLITDKSGKWN